jgi:DNA-binding NarL/FixJ family response regulator
MLVGNVMEPTGPLLVLALGDLARLRPAFDALAQDPSIDVDRGSGGGTPDAVVVAAERSVAVRRLGEARAAHPGAKVLVHLDGEDARLVSDLMASGACGVLCGDVDEADLRSAVRRAAAGEIVLPDHHVARLVSAVDAGRVRTTGEVLDRLTVREREILRSLAQGRSTAQIGSDLGISALTVQTHLKNILAKLGVHSKIEAITLAWRDGLAPMPTSA